MSKKLKTKKPTVESKLRERIVELENINESAGETYQKVLKSRNSLQEAVKVLHRFVKQAIAMQDIRKDTHFIVRHDIMGRDSMGERYEPTPEEMLNAITLDFLTLVKDFAREDEGTALMQEHKEDLMILLRGMIDDTTRPDDRRERLAGVIHNLELAKKNGFHVNLGNDNKPLH